MAFKQEVVSAFIILIIACVLFGCSAFMKFRTEGYTNYFTDIPEGMCGVDLPPCPFGSRCMNGYCKTDIAPSMPTTSGLPVKPQGYIRL
jgi:hypothetical protein